MLSHQHVQLLRSRRSAEGRSMRTRLSTLCIAILEIYFKFEVCRRSIVNRKARNASLSLSRKPVEDHESLGFEFAN